MSLASTASTSYLNLLAGEVTTVPCVVVAGEGALAAGSVLGKITRGALSGAASACVGVANGTLTLDATTPLLTGAQPGVYTMRCVTAYSADPAVAAKFVVDDPSGLPIGQYTVGGSAFATQIKFAITEGSNKHALGDAYKVTVTAAAGSGKYALVDKTATDGSAVAAGILAEAVTATADVTTAMITAGEVNGTQLAFANGTVLADVADALRALGIIVRTGVDID